MSYTTLFFDELNTVRENVAQALTETAADREKRKERVISEAEKFFYAVYVYGLYEVDEDAEYVFEDAEEAVNKVVAGKTFRDRLSEYAESDADDQTVLPEMMRVIETESHRIFVTAEYTEAAVKRYTQKTWRTMMDNKVRDTHAYLEDLTIGINDYFYTFDGDSALYPGDFLSPENNCGCRCHLKFS